MKLVKFLTPSHERILDIVLDAVIECSSVIQYVTIDLLKDKLVENYPEY